MRFMKRSVAAALVAAVALGLASCAPNTQGGASAPSGTEGVVTPVKVAMLTSQTGPLAAYGAAYTAGFEAGLDYATDGSGEVAGHKIDVTWADDQGNPDAAVAKAKDFIGQGYQILAGTAASGVATAVAEQAAQNKVLYISGPAAADAITGVNGYTFRSGRQTYQDVATAGTFIGDPKGKHVVVFAQDNAFGQGNLAAVKTVLGGKGATVDGVLVAEDATEFTPFAQQLIGAKPDLVFVAWAGASSGAMWTALTQQGVFDAAPVVTGLGDVATYGAYGDASSKISFLNHYFSGAAGTEQEKAMIAHLEKNGKKGDLFSPDGFVAAQMVVHAIEKGDGTVDGMVKALEGWSFDSVKGKLTIRAEDHALIQPMYQAKLVQSGSAWTPELVKKIDAESVTPPVAKK
ncbi:substrate-binding domain-containing protein [Microbacterium azadirachtae]|uniref:substrate-binding domain-containing protein n=1 Tax=Microbacterium azadirachtae TaxID=582680 RepID=UPI000B88633A|nr:substrate-binding domain-containing protein [Microbacterium azadirachtae]